MSARTQATRRGQRARRAAVDRSGAAASPRHDRPPISTCASRQRRRRRPSDAPFRAEPHANSQYDHGRSPPTSSPRAPATSSPPSATTRGSHRSSVGLSQQQQQRRCRQSDRRSTGSQQTYADNSRSPRQNSGGPLRHRHPGNDTSTYSNSRRQSHHRPHHSDSTRRSQIPSSPSRRGYDQPPPSARFNRYNASARSTAGPNSRASNKHRGHHHSTSKPPQARTQSRSHPPPPSPTRFGRYDSPRDERLPLRKTRFGRRWEWHTQEPVHDQWLFKYATEESFAKFPFARCDEEREKISDTGDFVTCVLVLKVFVLELVSF